MTELLMTPTDRYGFGMPLPIYPTDPFMNGSVNFHHTMHPGSAFERYRLGAELTPAIMRDMAVRMCRGQEDPKGLQNVYHGEYYGPDRSVATELSDLHLVVAAFGGFVPDQAIDMRRDPDDRVVNLTPDEWSKIATLARFHPEHATYGQDGQTPARRYAGMFMAHVISQYSTAINNEKLIQIFLDERTSAEKKRSVGLQILTLAAELSLEPVRPLFFEGLKRGLFMEIPLLKPTPLGVARNIMTKRHRERHLPTLEGHLRASLGLQNRGEPVTIAA